jgi:hypothetical protein
MGNEFISVAGGATNLAMDFKVSLLLLLPAGRLFSSSFRPPYNYFILSALLTIMLSARTHPISLLLF